MENKEQGLLKELMNMLKKDMHMLFKMNVDVIILKENGIF